MNEQIQHCLVVAVIIVSMAVGVAATRVNCRILPSGPIVVTPQAETKSRARWPRTLENTADKSRVTPQDLGKYYIVMFKTCYADIVHFSVTRQGN
jgi:hypothetical protein